MAAPSPLTENRRPIRRELIDELEDGLLACFGVLFDAWMKDLLAHDLADRIIDHFYDFVEATAAGSNGLERRFAMKFAMLYAAGMIGVEDGLLPWPDDWPMRAVRHCYENSLRQRDPEAAASTAAVRKLARSLRSRKEFPVSVDERGRYPQWGDDQIGFHLKRGDKTETFFAKERLRLVCGPEAFIETQVFARLLELKVVGVGSYTSASEQMRVRLPSGEIVKVRLWRLNRGPLMALAGTTAAGSVRAVGGDRRTPAPDATREPPAREVAGARRPQKLF